MNFLTMRMKKSLFILKVMNLNIVIGFIYTIHFKKNCGITPTAGKNYDTIHGEE